MRKIFIVCLVLAATIFFASCSRSISVFEAANGKAKCGRTLR